MPITVKGIGTAYYGQRDFRPDGSYVTTEWVVLFHLPVVPIRSLRVMGSLGRDENYFVYKTETYPVVGRLPLHGGQVLSTYGVVALGFAWIGLLLFLSFRFRLPWEKYPIAITVAGVWIGTIPAFIPGILRRRARQKIAFRQKPPLASQTPLKDLLTKRPSVSHPGNPGRIAPSTTNPGATDRTEESTTIRSSGASREGHGAANPD